MEEQSKYLESVQYQIDSFSASVENLANTFMDADFLKDTIKVGTTFVDLLDDIIEKLGTIPLIVGTIGAALSAKGVGINGDMVEGLFNFGKIQKDNNILGGIISDDDLNKLELFEKELRGGATYSEAFSHAMEDASESARLYASQFEDIDIGERNLREDFQTLDESTKKLNLSTIASSHSFSDNAKLIKIYNERMTDANGVTTYAGLSQETFNSTLVTSNTMMSRYISSLNGAEASMLGFIGYTVKATAVQVAFKAVAMASQMILGMFVSFVVGKLFTAFDNWVHKTEKLIEAGEEAKKVIDDINSTLKTQQQTVKESAKRFAELSQGVDQLTGKNLSLSDDDYQEFLDISNELAEVFPELSRHYDENGNAIVDLDGDVNTITSSLYRLLEVEQQIANQKILDNFDSVWKGLKAEDKDLIDDLADINAQINQIEIKIQHLQNGFSSGFLDADLIDVSDVRAILESYDIAFREDLAGIHVDASLLTDEIKDQILKDYRTSLDDLYAQASTIQNEETANWSEANDYIDLWLDQQFSKNPDKYSAELQAGIKQIVSNALSDPDNIWLKSAGSDEKVYQAIRDNVLKAFDDNEPLAIRYQLALESKTKFNNDEISVGEYEKQMQTILTLLNSLVLDEDVKKSILISLGIETNENGDIVNTQVNNLAKQLESAVGEESAKAIAEGLTKGELEAIQDSDIDWSELLKTGQPLDEQIEVVKNKISQISRIPFTIEYDKSTIETATEGIEDLQSVYQELYEAMEDGKVGEELAAQFADLDDLEESLGNVSDYQEIWDNFYNTMTDGTHSFEEMEDALNQVLTAYVNATIDLENFDAEQAKAISTQLQLAGVTKESADAYVASMTELANATQIASDAGYDLNNITALEIQTLVDEGNISSEVAELLAAYALQKQLANGYTITTSADVDNLLTLANAANVSIKSLARYAELKADLAEAEKSGDTQLIRNIKRTIDTYAKTLDTSALAAEVQVNANLGNKLSYDPKKLSSSSSGSSSSSSEDDTDEWLEAYEEELKKLNHLHEMELISDIQYYEERERLNDKYFKDNEKYTDEYTENLEEIYQGFKSAYKQYVDDMSDYWEKSLEAGLIDFNTYCSKMKTMLNDLRNAGKIDDETYYSAMADYYGTIVDNYDKAINAAQRVIEKQIESLEDQKEAIEESYQAQIDAIQGEIDALEKANEERQRELDLQTALYNLNRAENQRNQMVYKSDLGYVYEANSNDIKDAQAEVEETQFEIYISTLENKIASLEDEMEGLTDAIDEQIDKLQDYSDRLGEVADKWQEAQEDMVAASIWGSDWKNSILATDETLLANFTESYITMQQQQADMAVAAANVIVDSYNKQIEALNAWKDALASAEKTSGTSKLSSTNITSSSSGAKNSSSSTTTKTTTSTYQNSGRNYTKVVDTSKGSSRRISGMVYGSGTDNALPGYHEVAEDGDEIILDNYGNAYLAQGRQLHKFEGGEKVYNENETKELLSGKYVSADSIFPNYSDMMSKVMNQSFSASGLNSNYVSSKSSVKKTDMTPSVNITIGDINVSEVENATDLAKAITNQLPNALLQELKRK